MHDRADQFQRSITVTSDRGDRISTPVTADMFRDAAFDLHDE